MNIEDTIRTHLKMGATAIVKDVLEDAANRLESILQEKSSLLAAAAETIASLRGEVDLLTAMAGYEDEENPVAAGDYDQLFDRAYMAMLDGNMEPAKALLQELTGRVVETGTRYTLG